jgi:hypothetical protein
MAIGDRIEGHLLYNSTIDRSIPKARGLVKAIPDPQNENKIVFTTTFDGKVFPTFQEAMGNVEAIGLSDYRIFGRNPEGSQKGLDHIAEEAMAINQRLKNLSQTQKESLRILGLDDLIGQEISLTYKKHEYSSNINKLKNILKSAAVENGGIQNITDQGVTVLNYSVGKKVLDGQKALQLRYILGMGTLTDSFMSKMLGNDGQVDFGGFAKLPKRIQGMISERNVALTGKKVNEIFGVTTEGIIDPAKSKVFQFDYI